MGRSEKELFQVMNRFLEEPRKKYKELMDNPEKIDELLRKGAEKARARTLPFLQEVRKQIGVAR